MKIFTKISFLVSLVLVSMTSFIGCSDDYNAPQLTENDNAPQHTGESKQFDLFSKSNPTISGAITFATRDDGATLITIQLSGTSTGESYPAHIHANTAVEGGAILLDLTPVDGASGRSETVVTTLNDGSLITYQQLINDLNGYANVHLSASDLATIIAQGDIGRNELTTTSKTYALESVSDNNISGIAKFTKRVSGETLLSVALTGTTPGVSSIGHIHLNSVAQNGGVVVDLTPVTGATGKSETSISQLNTGEAITYDGLLNFNGHINFHESASNLSTIIAQGDIGRNELTATSKTYTLQSVSNNAISGTAKFTKRVSGEALVTIALTGTTPGVSSPAHIHIGSESQPGPIGIGLTDVNGTTGKSETSVTDVTYDELLVYNGYINVHTSATEMAILIAQGNIGANDGSVIYNVTNSGASDYVFNGGGLTDASDPALTLKRGSTYTFIVNASGHPFLIKTAQNTGSSNTYNDGVTNNGASIGTITFTVPANAPNTLYYICEFHAAMTGAITITD